MGKYEDYKYTTAKAIMYDHTKQSWLSGQPMKYPRQYHAVGIVIDEVTLEKLVFVTGGVSKVCKLFSIHVIVFH